MSVNIRQTFIMDHAANDSITDILKPIDIYCVIKSVKSLIDILITLIYLLQHIQEMHLMKLSVLSSYNLD